MPNLLRPRSPPIFTIRLWQEVLDDEHIEWRGQVKNIVSGEVRYFRDWATLALLLPRMLADTIQEEEIPGEEEEETK
jgi:hypothetical protein